MARLTREQCAAVRSDSTAQYSVDDLLDTIDALESELAAARKVSKAILDVKEMDEGAIQSVLCRAQNRILELEAELAELRDQMRHQVRHAEQLVKEAFAESEMVLRAPMECGHPKMFWVPLPRPNLAPDPDIREAYCSICADIATHERLIQAVALKEAINAVDRCKAHAEQFDGPFYVNKQSARRNILALDKDVQLLLDSHDSEITMREHSNHVQFFNDLYATLVDPLAEGSIKEADLMKALLESARWYRQHVYDLETIVSETAAGGSDAKAE
jgi:hypothetical protein